MFSTYEEDMKIEERSFISCFDLGDFFENGGWPDRLIYAFTSITFDIPQTINSTLKALHDNNVVNALVMVPTTHKIVRREENE